MASMVESWILLLALGIPCLLVFVGLIVAALMTIRRSRSNQNVFPCPDCGRQVPRFAESCPHCGRPLLESPE